MTCDGWQYNVSVWNGEAQNGISFNVSSVNLTAYGLPTNINNYCPNIIYAASIYVPPSSFTERKQRKQFKEQAQTFLKSSSLMQTTQDLTSQDEWAALAAFDFNFILICYNDQQDGGCWNENYQTVSQQCTYLQTYFGNTNFPAGSGNSGEWIIDNFNFQQIEGEYLCDPTDYPF